MKKTLTVIFVLIFSNLYSQPADKVFTSDIDNFWTAFDSIRQAKDYSKKLDFINKLYIKKGTKGLRTFMKANNYSDTVFVSVIDKYPRFWNSIRPNTLTIKTKTFRLNAAVENLRRLYPDLKEAEIYFTIGGLRAGGTVVDKMVLVGAEIAAGTSDVDVSEFRTSLYRNVFSRQSMDDIVYYNLHEYVHSQQKINTSNQLLNQAIKEGSCDFVAELVLDHPVQRPYLSYGKRHAERLKERFKEEMFSGASQADWLYNGQDRPDSADLGYFIGYQICKSYYRLAKDKKQAIKEIIELDYSSNKAVELFLIKSRFFKKNLIRKYERKKHPYIVKIGPFRNGSRKVDPKINEFRITFSKEMIPGNYSIDYSVKGKDHFPVKKVIGYENNNTVCVLSMALQSRKEYEFVITSNRFMSKDGHSLKEKEYIVSFKTR